jgi:hypothetical protein
MRLFRLLRLLLNAFIGYIWWFYFSKINAVRAGIILGTGVLLILLAGVSTRQDEMDRDFKGAKAQNCTFWTRTYPMRQFAIYAVGEGEKQYLRMDQFVSGATGRQAEYIIVISGIAYVWNTWSKNPNEGVKFPNPPAPFMEYFSVDSIKYKDFRCDSWIPEKRMFIVPKNITFRTVSVEEFERDEMYTVVLKRYIRQQMQYR